MTTSATQAPAADVPAVDTSTEATGRRDRKKAATRHALREAALRLALQNGYEQLTVEAITEAADVSVRTFFNYFTSKDDALLGLDPFSARELVSALTSRPASESPITALRAVLGHIAESFAISEQMWQARMELLHANPELWPKMFASMVAFERALVEAIAARTGLNPDVDLYPGVAAGAAMGAIRVALAHWRASNNDVALPDLFADAFDMLASGLRAPRAGAGTERQ